MEKLTSQQLNEYFEKYKKGDKKAKEIIIEQHLFLVISCGQKFLSTGFECDDVYSAGTLGLIRAVETFDLSKKINFLTYAMRCISSEICLHITQFNHSSQSANLSWDGNLVEYDPKKYQKKIS